MLSTETLHKDMIYWSKDLVGKGLSWPETESFIWLRAYSVRWKIECLVQKSFTYFLASPLHAFNLIESADLMAFRTIQHMKIKIKSGFLITAKNRFC